MLSFLPLLAQLPDNSVPPPLVLSLHVHTNAEPWYDIPMNELILRLKALFLGVEKTAKADEQIVANIVAKDRVAVLTALQAAEDAAIAAVKADTPEVEALVKTAVKDVVDALLAKLPTILTTI